MPALQINRICGKAAIAFSVIALLAVLSGYLQPPQPDEGPAAHIFQLAIAALLPTLMLFFATADWKEPFQSVRRLTIPASALVAAFAALYYLEHVRNIAK